MGHTIHCCHSLHIHLPLSCLSSHRDRIARIGLGVILNLAKERDIPQLAQSISGILEHMFKHSEETCFQLISDGGLDTILYWCRWTDPAVLRHCAMALANCAMYGGQANQRLMIEKKAAEWLFPLAFSKDDELIRLHACLAITVLATNKEIEKEVERSGTLALVEPFIASLDPEQFAREMLGSSDNIQGRTAQDLQRLVPLLDSSRLEAQCIAAFYLCTEAAIKARQKKTQVKGRLAWRKVMTKGRGATAASWCHTTPWSSPGPACWDEDEGKQSDAFSLCVPRFSVRLGLRRASRGLCATPPAAPPLPWPKRCCA